jgi:hypothetical protein
MANPGLVQLVTIRGNAIRSATVVILANLAKYGEPLPDMLEPLLTLVGAEFRDAICATIPSLIDLLRSQDIGVTHSTTSVLGKLATNSE